ncbi:MAG: phosphatase PAP2 family protein [Sulfuricurvum sp.]|nr:phosphatase PAP2 family protein [Sulfuricurvum sp.]
MNRALISNYMFLLFASAFLSYWYVDQALALYIHTLGINVSNTFFHAVTQFGDSKYPLLGTFLFYLIYRKSDKHFARKNLYIFSTVAISGLIVDIVKVIAGRMRPELFFENQQYGFSGFKFESAFYSFPSGHSATAFSFFIALALLNPKYKPLFIALALLIVLSRIILLQHYLSDVAIGSAIGAFSSYWIYHRYYLHAKSVRRFSLVSYKRSLSKSFA